MCSIESDESPGARSPRAIFVWCLVGEVRDSRALFEKRIRLGVEVAKNDSCFRIAMCYFDQFCQPVRFQPVAGIRKGNPVKVGVRHPDVSGMARQGFARLNQPKGYILSANSAQ